MTWCPSCKVICFELHSFTIESNTNVKNMGGTFFNLKGHDKYITLLSFAPSAFNSVCLLKKCMCVCVAGAHGGEKLVG